MKSTITVAVGDRHHMLTVTETGLRMNPSPSRVRAGAKSESAVRARCDCGSTILIRPFDLTRGARQSCGCQMRTAASARATSRNTTHGLRNHPLYHAWSSMLKRCENPKSKDYPNYGGRGITVCTEWHDPSTFIAYVEHTIGSRPDGLTLDRIDSDRGYEPGNLRWADAVTQRRNQRRYAGGA